ncbi:uncharacterized protein [Typha angustifolia]|uniref:uncharacterized protein isoform X2 n=1 Tax=Typha angustifolia TaxID=59011 RepID=UPI003C2F004F
MCPSSPPSTAHLSNGHGWKCSTADSAPSPRGGSEGLGVLLGPGRRLTLEIYLLRLMRGAQGFLLTTRMDDNLVSSVLFGDDGSRLLFVGRQSFLLRIWPFKILNMRPVTELEGLAEIMQYIQW